VRSDQPLRQVTARIGSRTKIGNRTKWAHDKLHVVDMPLRLDKTIDGLHPCTWRLTHGESDSDRPRSDQSRRKQRRLSRQSVGGDTTDRQVFWLPDRSTNCAFPSVTRQWLTCVVQCLSPDTAAGPRRIRTVFPILWQATHLTAPRSMTSCYRCETKMQSPSSFFFVLDFSFDANSSQSRISVSDQDK